jgi:hypothetical protein
MVQRKTHREICSLCYKVSRIGFWVPIEIWKLSVHRSQVNSIICLSCFTRLADERKVKWDTNIKFYPVSQITDSEIITEERVIDLPTGRIEKKNPKIIR